MTEPFSFNLAIRTVARERKWTIKKTVWYCGVATSTLRQLMVSRHTYISTIEKYAALLNMPTVDFIQKGCASDVFQPAEQAVPGTAGRPFNQPDPNREADYAR